MIQNPKQFILYFLFLVLFNLLSVRGIYAQEHQENAEHTEHLENTEQHSDETHKEGGHHEFKHWRVGFGIGHSYLPSGSQSGSDIKVLVIPTIGLDLQYWFNPKFGLALKNEFEIISYIIEDEDGSEIEREYPIISVLVGMYKLKNGPTFYLGAGFEYEHNHSFLIGKVGIEYELEIGRHWDVTPEFYYFNKDADFGGVGLAITFGKRF